MKPTALWQHLAPADHETFISSAICWLMDPKGDHGLSDKLLRRLLRKLCLIPNARSQLTIKAEESEGQDKRFDISAYENCEPIARFEVKCKTIGNLDQLKKYAKNGKKLGRIAFGEWNYEGLCKDDKTRYPLITFSCLAEEVCQVLEHTSPQTQGFVESLAKHLQNEHVFFEKLRGYLIEESTEDSPPQHPTMHRFSQRFYNQLYWHWFREKWREEDLPSRIWTSKSERSGVWLASDGKQVTKLSLPELNLHLSRPLVYWIHIELHDRSGILSDEDCEVGSIQLRITNDNGTDGNRDAIYEVLRNVRTDGFNPPSRRPRRTWNYWTGLERPLKLKDFRFSELNKLIDLLTPQD